MHSLSTHQDNFNLLFQVNLKFKRHFQDRIKTAQVSDKLDKFTLNFRSGKILNIRGESGVTKTKRKADAAADER